MPPSSAGARSVRFWDVPADTNFSKLVLIVGGKILHMCKIMFDQPRVRKKNRTRYHCLSVRATARVASDYHRFGNGLYETSRLHLCSPLRAANDYERRPWQTHLFRNDNRLERPIKIINDLKGSKGRDRPTPELKVGDRRYALENPKG